MSTDSSRTPPMKALTIRQPWASLIAAGVKTIETRSWSTKYRGPLAIHAGHRWDVGWSTHALWHDPDVPSATRDRNDVLVETLRCDPMEDCNGSGYWTVDAYGRRHIPLGAVVATCTLADVVTIVGGGEEGAVRTVDMDDNGSLWLTEPETYPPFLTGDDLTAYLAEHDEHDLADQSIYEEWCTARGLVEREQRDITDQLPFGDFTPGRYAWLLTDITQLAEPQPAKGRQGLWDWAGE